MKKFKLIVFGIIVALLVAFAWQNLSYFQTRTDLSLDLIVAGPYVAKQISNAVICIVTFLLGTIMLYLVSLSGRIKQRKSMKTLNSTLNEHQNEINALKKELDASKTSPPSDMTPPDNAEIQPKNEETVNSAS